MSDLLIHVTRRAMACEFEVQYPEKYAQGTELALESLDLVDSLEEQLSFFRMSSAISRINLLAAEQSVEVPPPLFDLLQTAVNVFQETDGAYDITATPLWEAWGFARREGRIPSDAQLAEARANVGSQWVELNDAEKTIRFLRPGIKINLGSIGKGYALDRCGEHLQTNGLPDFLLHGGQSSVLAHGVSNVSRPWEVGIRHPGQPGRRIGIVRLRNRALGTSGGQFQSFRHRGHRYSHILDPRTGMPAEGLLSATVVAPTAALADALSTAFFVLGPETSLNYCESHPEVGVVLLCPDQRSEFRVHTKGLDAETLRLDVQPYGGIFSLSPNRRTTEIHHYWVINLSSQDSPQPSQTANSPQSLADSLYLRVKKRTTCRVSARLLPFGSDKIKTCSGYNNSEAAPR